MDRHQLHFFLLKLTAVVLVASTWVFLSFVFKTRPEEVHSDTLSSLVRLPASLRVPKVFAPVVKAVEPIAMDVVKLPCWDRAGSAPPDTSARWIRLTGRTCQLDSEDQQEISVSNLTNGYVATVFPLQAKGLTTDFIPLREGKNEILIRFKSDSGTASETQIALTRE